MEDGIPKGTAVGSYVIDSPLGRGGMGVVYRAFHPRLQRWAAIKMLPPFAGGTDARERFEREARAIARLRHRHILTVFDFGEFAGQPYMAVEYMPNGALQDRMPSGPITAEEALTVLRPLAEALDYAHTQGVLHRDVKPANIFLDAELQPVLADFGLAKLYSEESLTMTGMVSGTPTHISPEQANGRPLSGATDQYSLAVLAYQLLTAGLPFQGALMELLYAHVNTPPDAPSTRNPALNPFVDEVLLRALGKEPAERFPTCARMVSALEAAAAGRVDERRPRTAPVAAAAVAPTVVVPRAPAPPGRRRSRRAVWVAAIAIALAALATVAVAANLMPSSSKVAAVSGTPTPHRSGVNRSPSPTATPRRAPTVSVSPGGALSPGETVTVNGSGLTPGPARAGFVKAAGIEPISAIDITVAADGTYRQEGIVPRDMSAGEATLVVCNLQTPIDLNRCARATVTVR